MTASTPQERLMAWLSSDPMALRAARDVASGDWIGPEDDSLSVLLDDLLYEDGAAVYGLDLTAALYARASITPQEFAAIDWVALHDWLLTTQPPT